MPFFFSLHITYLIATHEISLFHSLATCWHIELNFLTKLMLQIPRPLTNTTMIYWYKIWNAITHWRISQGNKENTEEKQLSGANIYNVKYMNAGQESITSLHSVCACFISECTSRTRMVTNTVHTLPSTLTLWRRTCSRSWCMHSTGWKISPSRVPQKVNVLSNSCR